MLTPTASGASLDAYASRAIDLVWHLLGMRVWSMAARHAVPPESYANLLSTTAAKREASAACMRRNWKCVVLLEHLCRGVAKCAAC